MESVAQLDQQVPGIPYSIVRAPVSGAASIPHREIVGLDVVVKKYVIFDGDISADFFPGPGGVVEPVLPLT